MAAELFYLPSPMAFGTNGIAVPGAKANFYLTGTLTRTPVYSDSGLTTEHTNPVVADGAGRFPVIYLDDSVTYRLIITDANGGSLGYDVDPYTAPVTPADIAATSASAEAAALSEANAAASESAAASSSATAQAAANQATTAANQATTAGNTFDDTTAGIAGTASGNYFTIPSASGDGYLDLYKNNAGTAVFQKTYPSLQALSGTALLKYGIDWLEEVSDALNVGIYTAQDLGTLWQDEAGTVAVTQVGDTVQRIDDLSGNDLHLRRFGDDTAVLAQHESGAYYVDCPTGSRFQTQDGVFPATITLTPPVLMAVSLARGSQSSQGLFGFGKGNADALQFKGINNQQGIQPTIARTGRTSLAQNLRGRQADGEPCVLDLYLDTETLSSWQNGGNATMPRDQFAGGKRSQPTTWDPTDTITTARWGINANGGATVGDTHFYGAVIVNGQTVSPALRQRITEWLKRQTRLDVLDAYEYDVFAFIGDSIMDGQGDRLLSTPPDFGNGVEYLDSNNLRPLLDPTQGLESIFGKGSLKPAFAKQWFTETGRRVCAVGCSMSGEGILGHSATYDGYTANGKLVGYTADKIESAMQLLGGKRGARFRGFVCLLGSNDAPAASGVGYTSTQYEAEIVALLDRLRVATGYSKAPLFLISPDRRTDGANDTGFERIRQAHIDAAANNADIYLVNPYQNYAATGDFVDVIHWGQNNMNDAGTRAATNTALALELQLP